jgi:hypothetical protein
MIPVKAAANSGRKIIRRTLFYSFPVDQRVGIASYSKRVPRTRERMNPGNE